jgi:hypothetical protein
MRPGRTEPRRPAQSRKEREKRGGCQGLSACDRGRTIRRSPPSVTSRLQTSATGRPSPLGARASGGKLRGKDSNLDYLIQSQASYH